MTAALHVLSTPELLENILRYLSPTQLLHARTVNKTFEALIASSPSLRRKLFLIEDTNDSTARWIGVPYGWHGELHSCFLGSPAAVGTGNSGIINGLPLKVVQRYEVNTTVFHLAAGPKEKYSTRISLKGLPNNPIERTKILTKSRTKYSIYDNMQVTKPPINTLNLDFFTAAENGKGSFHWRITLDNARGITVGQVLHEICTLAARESIPSLRTEYLHYDGVIFASEAGIREVELEKKDALRAGL